VTVVAGPLQGIRVIDATGVCGELAGRVLADLGAEVIKLEPPGGAAARFRGPFEAGREGDPEASLYWAAVALGKRSAVLDPLDPREGARLRALLRAADVLLESFTRAERARAGLEPDRLLALNPGLVCVSITPFGSDGPLADAPASELTVEAAGGLLSLQGDRDRPPIPVGFPQAWFHAGAQAAADVVIALCERLRSGRGQHIDVSAQAAVVGTLMNATGFPSAVGRNPPATCEYRTEPPPPLFPGVDLPYVVPCADGWALVGLGIPGLGERTLHALLCRAEAAGQLDPELRAADFGRFIGDTVEGKLEIPRLVRAIDAARAFLATCTKRGVQEIAVAEGILLGPIQDMRDVLGDPQLRARGYWTEIAGRTYPGAFAQASATPIGPARPAPALGEGQALIDRVRSAPVPHTGPPPGDGPFAGLKVADFSWIAVAPQITKALADHGATVVRVESETRLDITRILPPFRDDKPGINNAQFMANFNTSKLGIALNLATEGGQRVARRLADWADVVVESFTPGTMARFGLDWEALSAGRPELIMLSTSLRGDTGPERGYTGFGTHGAALAGLLGITGWPDRPPIGPWGAYTDFIAQRYGIAALAAALHHRALTGRGQRIDLSQIEAAIHFVEPLLLDCAVNGRVAGPSGHASPYACPHGVYRCAGHERYVAIAVETPVQWEALRCAAPLDEFADPALRALAARSAKRDALEARLADWCAAHDAFALAERLRRTGVPAYAVLRPTDLFEDPQLGARGFFVPIEHPVMGMTRCDGFASRFSRTPARLRSPAPLLGEHTHGVLRDLLGYSDEEITELAIAGALS
jgi:crotonobetainyl-CoA:carnitine CoA-transferase CaiB-like acyl-CoA transferase